MLQRYNPNVSKNIDQTNEPDYRGLSMKDGEVYETFSSST
jgi:hypothetical protein